MSNFFVHPSSFVDDDVHIGDGTSIWHFCHLQKGATVGCNCNIGQNVYIGNNVIIGNHVKIQNNVSVYSGVVLEDFVFCGPSCVFTNDLTPRAKYPKGSGRFEKTIVRTGASIGANATIVCATEIGAWAIIGAGAVVTKDVPCHALMLGVPAKQHGWVCECGQTLSETLFCESCSKRYSKGNKGLTLVNGLDET